MRKPIDGSSTSSGARSAGAVPWRLVDAGRQERMTAGTAFRLVLVMGLWAACFPLITLGLELAPHLAFAAMRAAIAWPSLVGDGALAGYGLGIGYVLLAAGGVATVRTPGAG